MSCFELSLRSFFSLNLLIVIINRRPISTFAILRSNVTNETTWTEFCRRIFAKWFNCSKFLSCVCLWQSHTEHQAKYMYRNQTHVQNLIRLTVQVYASETVYQTCNFTLQYRPYDKYFLSMQRRWMDGAQLKERTIFLEKSDSFDANKFRPRNTVGYHPIPFYERKRRCRIVCERISISELTISCQ